MSGTQAETADTEEYRRDWHSEVEDFKRVINFNLDEVTWTQVRFPKDGQPGHPESLRGKVDFEAYYDHGMWTAFIDAGAFNILGVKLAPNFTIPRHHHNLHQLVLVHEGEVWQGRQRFVPGDGYFTRADHPYSVTAGPEGSIAFEIRFQPIQDLGLVWDDVDPAKWVHGRRPGGPAADLKPTEE
jgi:hypothetical protein